MADLVPIDVDVDGVQAPCARDPCAWSTTFQPRTTGTVT